MEEVYNMAVEFEDAGKFNEGLSLCLDMLPKIEASKEWDAKYITNWYNKMVLKPKSNNLGEENTATTEKTTDVLPETQDGPVAGTEESVGSVESQKTGTKDVFDTLKQSKDKRSFNAAIADILTAQTDNENLRNLMIAAIKAGTGAETIKRSKSPLHEIHGMINNIKAKMGAFNKEKVTVE